MTGAGRSTCGPRQWRCGSLGQVEEPVGVPRCPVWIIAVDDAVDEVMGLAGLAQKGCDCC